MDKCLDGINHIDSNGVGIQRYFFHGGLILQICYIHCDKDSLQHRRSCEVVFQEHSEVLGSFSEHCVGHGCKVHK